MGPRLPSKVRLVSAGATLVSVASVLIGGFLALYAVPGLMTVDGPLLGTVKFTQSAIGIGLTVFGCLVFWFVARRDASPPSEDEESHSDAASTLLWPW